MRKYRPFTDGLANGTNRPEARVQDRPYRRAERAQKRSLAEGVGCARGELCPSVTKAAKQKAARRPFAVQGLGLTTALLPTRTSNFPSQSVIALIPVPC